MAETMLTKHSLNHVVKKRTHTEVLFPTTGPSSSKMPRLKKSKKDVVTYDMEETEENV